MARYPTRQIERRNEDIAQDSTERRGLVDVPPQALSFLLTCSQLICKPEFWQIMMRNEDIMHSDDVCQKLNARVAKSCVTRKADLLFLKAIAICDEESIEIQIYQRRSTLAAMRTISF